LNHIEIGVFGRDDQFQGTNREGDMLVGVREKSGIKSGSINGGVKAVCSAIMSDWQARKTTPVIPASVVAPAPPPAADRSIDRMPASASPVAYQQPNSDRVSPPTQAVSQLVSSDESLGDAACHARQRKACFDLMKDSPSIACN
jgi:hypothetical protein